MERLDSILLVAEALEKLEEVLKEQGVRESVYTKTKLIEAGFDDSLIKVLRRRKVIELSPYTTTELFYGYKVEFDNMRDLDKFSNNMVLRPDEIKYSLKQYTRSQEVTTYRIDLMRLDEYIASSREEISSALRRLRRFE